MEDFPAFVSIEPLPSDEEIKRISDEILAMNRRQPMTILPPSLQVIGLCGGCKWWNQERVVIPRGWGSCELTRSEECSPLQKDDTLAVVNSDWRGELATAPNFGCVQFEAKEE